jgi:hypothetical protein
MKRFARLFLLFSVAIAALHAQAPVQAPVQAPATDAAQTPSVPISEEPHHHLTLQNSYVRVYRVAIISPDATPMHRHDNPYIYMSIGDADFTNAVEGKPDAEVKMENGQLGYSKGGFSHVIRTANDKPFYNITIELLHPQNNLRSDCAKVLQGPLVGCSAPQAAVAGAANKIASESSSPAAGIAPGTGSNTTLAQSTPDNAKAAAAAPPAFTAILESDESALKLATFPANARTSLEAGPAGTLLVIEPLSQFKLDFSDGSSQLVSGGDPVWLKAGSTATATNSSDQTSSSLLLFTFKDSEHPAAK